MKEADTGADNAKKKGKIRSTLKKIFFKVFGKARWFLIFLAVLFFTYMILGTTDKSGEKLTSLVTDGSSEDYAVKKVDYFKANDDGYALAYFVKGAYEVYGIKNIETDEQVYAGVPVAKIGEKYYTPFYMIMGDKNDYYGLCLDYGGEDEASVADEYVVGYKNGKDSAELLCHIKYDLADRVRFSRITSMNCYNGELTFAVLAPEETLLYSINTETSNVRISKPYLPDANGNYTDWVIPLDGKFLFMQSNGEVYLQNFDEPLTNLIYKIDASADNIERDLYFDLATMTNGKLFVARSMYDDRVYCLENQKMTLVADLSGSKDYDGSRYITDISSYSYGGKDVVCIATNNGVELFDGEKLSEYGVTLHLENHFYCVIEEILLELSVLCILGLIINLIIRKKTLLYKQILITVPVIVIPSILGSMALYSEIQEDNVTRSKQEVEQVCRVATSSLEGFDFTDFKDLNQNVGIKTMELSRKLRSFDTDDGRYVFSVIYVTDDANATVLGISDRVTRPLYHVGPLMRSGNSEAAKTDENFYLFEEVSGVMEDDSNTSRIYAYGVIKDSKDCGRYYLKVQTNTWNFWVMRRDWFTRIIQYIVVAIAALIFITVLTSLFIVRAIKKATNTVVKIAGGDFSARVKYKSKDELGDICSQVNTMATSLETMFEEKDRTEKFYYKFVPEQFRRFLNKDNFTDLQLGDARSRELTVLFCDIRSFSINSEIMTAKETFEFINKVYGIAGPIVRQNNGFVDKYIGDAVMALFESADDAVHCGIEMYKAIALDPAMAESLGVSAINIGIGIHSGMAMVGIVGETERLSGTVISDTVNLSSRLESLTKQFKTGMLISKDAVDRLADSEAYDLRYLGILQVAGVNEVKGVYEVLDCLPSEVRSARAAHRDDLREAIRLFHMGERDEAVKKLSSIESVDDETDGVIKKYENYISELSDEEKGNVFRFTRK